MESTCTGSALGARARAQLLHQGRTRIFFHTLLLSVDHQYFNGKHEACEVLTRMYVILTRSELLFIYKRIQEIISMPWADSGYSHNFMANSWVFKDNESKSEAKTNSGPRVCPLLVEGPHFACAKYAQCPLLAHHVGVRTYTHKHKNKHTHTHTHTHT